MLKRYHSFPVFRHCRALLSTVSQSLPSQARAVIVGGGIIGNSIAYHLAKMGMKDVVLLEQHQLTAGTTWHAAGLMVTFGSKSETVTEMRKYSRSLYNTLENETGLSTGFKPCGFIELAPNKDRLEEYRRISAFNRKCGVDVQEISANDVQHLFPLCRVDDILAGFYVPTDGRVNPVDVSMSLAKGARNNGVKIFEGVTVDGVTEVVSDGRRRVTGVSTSTGHHIQAEFVVNCAGMWARQLGEASGVVIPNQAAEHYYIVTERMPDVDPSWPVVEDPSSHTYIRPEGGGLMVGLFEPVAAAWNVSRIPQDFSFGEITPDWERMAPFVETAMNRVPATLGAGVKNFFCGPESFTPDLGPVVGEAPELKNYFVTAGLNSIGIISGGGMGRIVASWIINGKPDVDVTSMNINRFQKYQCAPEYRGARVVESLANVYLCHYPYKKMQTAREAKKTPFYDRMKARGAVFNDISGWEVPDYFDSQDGTRSAAEKAYSWGRPHFFENWRREHTACREGVALFDMSFMSKYMVQGRDAGQALNRLCTADINGSVDTITYTQFLNEDGNMEGDVTVCKLAWDKFLVIATDTMHRHVGNWLDRNLDPSGVKHVLSSDVTGGYAQLNVQGPLSRELLKSITDTDMSDAAFPFRAAKGIFVGYAPLVCARITYVGELGYELHIPCEFAQHVYDRVVEAGKQFDLTHCGLKALGSLRLEKAYRDYGHDMDNMDSLMEVGLGFTADMNKADGFLGDHKVRSQKADLKAAKGLRRRLVQVLVQDKDAMMYHGEVLWRNDEIVGDVRIGSYGHTLGGPVGLAMVELGGSEVVNKSFLESGKWEVEISNRRFPVRVSLAPMYDPQNTRIKS